MKTAVLALAVALGWTLLHVPAARAADSAFIERGRTLYTLRNCAACHGPDVGPPPGRALPGTAALRKRYGKARPAVLADRTDLEPAYIRLIVRQGLHLMPYFRKTEVSDEDLNAIVAYLTRNHPAKP